ncbi:MAG TPA: hypothetical protein VNW97_12985 [Candidatus Saccharimonadales bacterium]|nr:hypothetical protein [Candidatus Saccharimonadales bacterium]
MSKNRSRLTPERLPGLLPIRDAAMKLCCRNAADVTAGNWGPTSDSFLEEERIREEVEAVAVVRRIRELLATPYPVHSKWMSQSNHFHC